MNSYEHHLFFITVILLFSLREKRSLCSITLIARGEDYERWLNNSALTLQLLSYVWKILVRRPLLLLVVLVNYFELREEFWVAAGFTCDENSTWGFHHNPLAAHFQIGFSEIDAMEKKIYERDFHIFQFPFFACGCFILMSYLFFFFVTMKKRIKSQMISKFLWPFFCLFDSLCVCVLCLQAIPFYFIFIFFRIYFSTVKIPITSSFNAKCQKHIEITEKLFFLCVIILRANPRER